MRKVRKWFQKRKGKRTGVRYREGAYSNVRSRKVKWGYSYRSKDDQRKK